MSCLHFWRRPAEIDARVFDLVCQDVRQLLDVVRGRGVYLAGRFGHGEPVIHTEEICFSAPYPAGRETFILRRSVVTDFDLGASVWEQCEADASYDLPVKAVLLVARHYVGAPFVIDSANRAAYWCEARQFCQEVIGYGKEVDIL